MPQPIVDITMAACNLKAAAPDHFKIFCDTLRAYEVKSITEVVAADAPEVFRAQGKVKTLQELRKAIVECYELRDHYIKRG